MDEEDESGRGPSGDMLLVMGRYGKTDDDAYAVLRRRGESVEVGAIRGLEEGKPIHGEVVRLHGRAEHPLLFSVETVDVVTPPLPAAARSGPPQVATDRYRAGWELVFGAIGGNKDAPN